MAAADRPLTRRQWQVIDLVRQAKPNKEIAHRLGLKEATIREYVSRLCKTLHLPNRVALAVWASEQAQRRP